MIVPIGFSFAGYNAGIKAVRRDMALIVSDVPCVGAGCFTTNKTRAAAVEDAAARMPMRGARAIVVNSGNANALTGPRGAIDVAHVHNAFARELGVAPDAVFSASTGVIGVPLPVSKLVEAAGPMRALLTPKIESAAEAILTTDTRVKLSSRVVRIGDRNVTIAAFAKGSGMIAPSLATMLAFILTDAVIEPAPLQAILSAACDATFNNLTVDNDMSTNDAVFALANGLARNPEIRKNSAEYCVFLDAMTSICTDLAKAIAEDGEGATKFVEVTVKGAESLEMARDLAKSIAGSSLVKAAIFGADPNWGRIMSTVGARAATNRYPLDVSRCSVEIQAATVFKGGLPVPIEGTGLRAKMREPQISVGVDLGEGAYEATAWGCDLSYDYVKINADYTSLTAASPDGTVAKDDRLTNYSPSFKRTLLVEALSYIERFKGMRAVVKNASIAGQKESLRASFATDVDLLQSAGLVPTVVEDEVELGATADSIAIALKAHKLIYLVDAPGFTEEGELVSEMRAATLREKLGGGALQGAMAQVGTNVLRAIDGGVASVHIIDGRMPHGLIAELFTDTGVGTLITK